MKKIYLVGFCILLFGGGQNIFPQINIDINKYIENPGMFGENKEAPTSILIPFHDSKTALDGNADKSEFYSSLNGQWKFEWEINPTLTPGEFYSKNFNDKSWNEIPVPSNWQMQGYDHQMYRNIPMEFICILFKPVQIL
jgi:hypothetical protein